MADTDSRRDGTGSNYARYFGIGFTFTACFAFLAVVGYFLDRWFGTLPLFLLLGLVAGFVGGLYYVYRILSRLGGG